MAGLLDSGGYDLPQAPGLLPMPPPPPADPQAAISAAMQTPDQQLKAYVKGHALSSALRMLGSTLSDVGTAFQGGQGNAEAQQMQSLYAQAAQPLQLIQAKARIAGLMQAYAQATPQMKALILSDPEKAIATIAQNQQLQTVGLNQQLQNQSGAVAAPIDAVTPFSAEGGGVLNKTTGQFSGISTPQTIAPGATAYPFTPSIAGQPSQPGPMAFGAASAGANPQPQAAPMPNAALASMVGPDGKLNPSAFYRGFILPHEGGLNPSDMNGSPTNYGFNQAANMDINVKRLTPETATSRYVAKYWPQSGSANLDPALAAINADTSFINPSMAKTFLAQSGGDPAKYMGLRQAWMAHLVATNPRAARYANAWDQRNAQLSQLAGIGASTAAPGAPSPVVAPPAAAGFGPPIIQGKQARVLSPQEAQAQNLAPGVWSQMPDGTLKQTSTPPDGDMKRLDSLTSTAQMLRELTNEQRLFMQHNQNVATGFPLGEPKIGNHEFENPVTNWMESTNPDLQAMVGSHARQTFMVKPPASGRVMQSEIPYWASQAQSPGNQGPVNQGILNDNLQRLQTIQGQTDFYRNWVYQHGNLQGADQAWAKIQQAPTRPSPGAHPAASAAPTATDARGNRVQWNGKAWVALK